MLINRIIRYVRLAVGVWGAVAIVWWLALQLMTDHNTDYNYFFNVVYAMPALVGGLAGFLVARRWGGVGSVLGRAIRLFSFGVVANAMGLFIWTFYNLTLGAVAPTPSMADFSWYLMYVAMIASIVVAFGALPSPKITALGGQRPLLVGVATVVVFLTLIASARSTFEGTDITATLINAGYLVGDAFFLGLVVVGLSFWGGKLSRFMQLALYSMAIRVVADLLFLVRLNVGTYWNGDVSDLLFAASNFLEAYAILSADIEVEKVKGIT